MKYTVKIERGPLAAMLMNGLETFLLPMKNIGKKQDSEKVKGHEVFAYIFGRREKKDKNTYKYIVEFINFDITARSSQDWVRTNAYAFKFKKAISEIVLPQRKLLGSFHTHPYRLLNEQGKTLTDKFGEYMWTPSRTDIEDDSAEDFQLDLILTVTNAQKTLTKGTCRLDNNCFQFNLDNIRFCLAAYVGRDDEDLSYPPYVDYTEVFLKRPEGLWKLPKRLSVESSIKKRIFKI